MPTTLYRIVAGPTARTNGWVCGLIAQDGVIIKCAPILRGHLLGKTTDYMREQGVKFHWTIEEIPPYVAKS